MTVGRPALQLALARRLAADVPELDPGVRERVVAAVVATFADADVDKSLTAAMLEAFTRASMAYNLRDDLYNHPASPATGARVAIDTLQYWLGVEVPRPRFPRSVEEGQALLDAIQYKDFKFQLAAEPLGDYSVVATGFMEDNRKPGRKFGVTGRAPLRVGLYESAFAAAMAAEDHEAREEFRVEGRRVFDPHGGDGASVGPQVRADLEEEAASK